MLACQNVLISVSVFWLVQQIDWLIDKVLFSCTTRLNKIVSVKYHIRHLHLCRWQKQLFSVLVQLMLSCHQSPSFAQLRTTAHPPGPPRNLTFNFYLDFETNTFKGNATWLGPELPEGKLIEYSYVLSSASASTIVGGTISVEVCWCLA